MVKTIKHGSCTIIMRRPELTRKERAERERAAQDTLETVMREYLKRKNK